MAEETKTTGIGTRAWEMQARVGSNFQNLVAVCRGPGLGCGLTLEGGRALPSGSISVLKKQSRVEELPVVCGKGCLPTCFYNLPLAHLV